MAETLRIFFNCLTSRVNVKKNIMDCIQKPLIGWKVISINLTLENTITGGEIYNYQVVRSLVDNGAQLKTLNFPIPRGASLMRWCCFALPWVWLIDLLSLFTKSIVITDSCFAPLMFIQFILLRIFSPVKLVVLNHHSNASSRKYLLMKLGFWISERLLLRCGHIIFLNSKRTYDEMNMKRICWKVYHVPPAISIKPRYVDRRKRKRDYIKLLFVGYLFKRKGLHILIESLSYCKDFDWELQIVGDESFSPVYSEHCRQKVENLGLNSRISFLGFLESEQLEEEYIDADLFILPSEQEGYGVVYVEASSFALPIITTEVGLIGDILIPGDSVYTVPFDDVNALAEAIRKLAKDKALRIRLGENAYNRIDYAYGIEEMYQRASAILLKALLKYKKRLV